MYYNRDLQLCVKIRKFQTYSKNKKIRKISQYENNYNVISFYHIHLSILPFFLFDSMRNTILVTANIRHPQKSVNMSATTTVPKRAIMDMPASTWCNRMAMHPRVSINKLPGNHFGMAIATTERIQMDFDGHGYIAVNL